MKESTWAARLLLRGCRFLRNLSSRSPFIEKMTGSELSPAEGGKLTAICHASGQTIGGYYHWKIEQSLMMSLLVRKSPVALRRLIASCDCSDYKILDTQLQSDPAGLIIAIPHHGHFPASIIAAAERISDQRRVSIFYDSPVDLKSNSMFDQLHGLLYSQDSSVSVIHNTKRGLIQVIRELRAGQVVVIMPDVVGNADETWLVPFLSRYRATPLGTASIARMTGASVLPMVSTTKPGALDFESVFSPPLTTHAIPNDPAHEVYADYAMTCAIFREFGSSMKSQLFAWQYAKSHDISAEPGSSASSEKLLQLGELLLLDPRMQVNRHSPVIQPNDLVGLTT